MKDHATQDEINNVASRLLAVGGVTVDISRGQFKTVIGALGEEDKIRSMPFEAMAGVERAVLVLKPYHLVASEGHDGPSVVHIDSVPIGAGYAAVIAGNCAVETRQRTLETAQFVADAGAQILRGEALKPRSSPYSFQGLGEMGLQFMAEARELTGLPFVAEVLKEADVTLAGKYADCLRIGSRNMGNFELLKVVGQQPLPIILKRGLGSTIEEWLLAAEYVASNGNLKVILCERGIRTFEPATRFTLDLSAVPILKSLTHLPVIVDPSHGVGKKLAVASMARAAIAAGADGVMIDVHPCPEEALCDGDQALLPSEFKILMGELRAVAAAVGVNL
ncbi:MAG: 3-deoxy-7-phosphoheptulonate synthase [Candidatus Saccharimonadia bacterium]